MDRSAEIVHARVVAHGRVQGVFFRDTMRRAAERLSVTGSAVNRSDGSVECHFEGPHGLVDEMISLARRGPQHAAVTDLEVEWLPTTGANGFLVA